MKESETKLFTRELYSKNSEEYDNHRLLKSKGRFLSEHDISLFNNMLPPNICNKIVLEVGAGTGRFTIPLLKKNQNIQVLSTDINETMLSRLRNRAKNEGVESQSKSQIEDVFNLSFADNHFDFVFGIHLIPRFTKFEDQKEAIKEIARVIKPNGKLLFNYRNSNSPYKYFYNGYSISPIKINSILSECGLTLINQKGKWIITRRLLDIFPKSFSKLIGFFDKILWGVYPQGAWDVFVLVEKTSYEKN